MFASSSQLNEQLPNNLSNLNLYKLYEEFINEKKNIFIQEKCHCQGNIHVKKILNENFKSYLDIYENLALEMTFRKELLQDLEISENVVSTFIDDLCTNGILEYSESCRFIHETFKEFFAAKWLISQIFILNEKTIRIIMEKILMKSFGLKTFVETYLEYNWDKLTDDILLTIGSITSKYNEIFSDMLYVNCDFPFIMKLMVEKCENVSLLNKIFKDYLNLFSTEGEFFRLDFIFYLIQKGANANCKTEKGKNLLHIAVERNKLEIVKNLLDNVGFNVDEEDIKGVTPLILAILKSNLEMAEYLIERGADINELKKLISITYNRRRRKVTIEYKHNDYRSIRSLRNYSTSVIANCLHIAAYNGNLSTIKFILSKNVCKIDEMTSHNGNVLHCAAQSGNLDVVKYFVNLNVSLEQISDIGETVLHFAVCTGSLDMVKYFVTLDVSVDAITHLGHTALYLAVYHSKYEIIEYLLQTYLRLEIPDATSVHSALSVLLKMTNYNDLFKTLYEKYKYYYSENSLLNLLSEAIRFNNSEMVNFMSKGNINDTQVLAISS